MSAQAKTGYPSIDKPWLKYYSEKDQTAVLPKMTMYQMLWNSRKEHLDADCLYYYGQKISYRVFINNIHKTVNVFSKMGIKRVNVIKLPPPPLLHANLITPPNAPAPAIGTTTARTSSA